MASTCSKIATSASVIGRERQLVAALSERIRDIEEAAREQLTMSNQRISTLSAQLTLVKEDSEAAMNKRVTDLIDKHRQQMNNSNTKYTTLEVEHQRIVTQVNIISTSRFIIMTLSLMWLFHG
jgi:hypothetical protein